LAQWLVLSLLHQVQKKLLHTKEEDNATNPNGC
jgi:hypothetical protein